MDQGVVRPWDERPETASRPAELFVHEHLFEHRPALPADIAWKGSADESGVDRRLADPGLGRLGQPPAGALEFALERLQDVAGERARSTLELQLAVIECQVHPASMAHAGTRAPPQSRAAGRSPLTDRRGRACQPARRTCLAAIMPVNLAGRAP